MVIDDEELSRNVLSDLLVEYGYDVVSASGAEEALDLLEGCSPDVILTDVMMPGIDGTQLTRKIREREELTGVPIVMVSALGEVEDRVSGLEAGADDFLVKPVDAAELRARMSNLMKLKAYHDHMRSYHTELESEVRKKTEELRRAYEKISVASLDTVFALTRAAEYRDEDTGTHIQRMSNYSIAIGRHLGVKETLIEKLLYASAMHDIGKIGIPDSILLKPGKLGPDEWEKMKQHTTIGAQILSDSATDFVELGRVIALTHHEKWDGSGYPRGLVGDKIPLVGRITALADVFDALTSKRPYKDPFSIEESLEIIQSARGHHFDPQVVDAFLEKKDEILQIRRRYSDDRKKVEA